MNFLRAKVFFISSVILFLLVLIRGNAALVECINNYPKILNTNCLNDGLSVCKAVFLKILCNILH